jgi:hypothetical protein
VPCFTQWVKNLPCFMLRPNQYRQGDKQNIAKKPRARSLSFQPLGRSNYHIDFT